MTSPLLRALGISIGLCVALATRPAVSQASTATAEASTSLPTRSEAAQRAEAAATALLTAYNPETGLFRTTGWWNSANAITALADTARLTRSATLPATIRNTFAQAPHKAPAFLNDFYDDEGWWALAWIDSYTLTRDPGYLHAAKTIFTDMSLAWTPTCNGGIWWDRKRTYKNAIANELFLSVAANLALHTRGPERARYLDWASREWAWFQSTGMINPDHLVNDGLTPAPDGTCHNNGKTTWTYNQGVLLGGLTALSQATRNPALLTPANAIATAALTHLTDIDGILHDPCEPNCGEDGIQFKGIFTRNLAELTLAAPDPAYTRALAAQAAALWTRARTPDTRFSVRWSGPPDDPHNAGAQSSALDALNAALATGSHAANAPGVAQ